MRLWSVHPQYLDRQGLTALWREGLLAQAVLRGRTRGYRSHPQLDRFRDCDKPLAMISTYLRAVCDEATRRGYEFDSTKIEGRTTKGLLSVNRGQLLFEWTHLRRKLRARSPEVLRTWRDVESPLAHPLFRIVDGDVADWERAATRR